MGRSHLWTNMYLRRDSKVVMEARMWVRRPLYNTYIFVFYFSISRLRCSCANPNQLLGRKMGDRCAGYLYICESKSVGLDFPGWNCNYCSLRSCWPCLSSLPLAFTNFTSATRNTLRLRIRTRKWPPSRCPSTPVCLPTTDGKRITHHIEGSY